MQTLRTASLLALGAALLAGCKGGAPYSPTLSVDRSSTASAITTSYRVVEGGNPVEQKSVVGAGDNCVIAGQSSGTYTTTLVYEQLETFNVVGETRASHPLVPGDDEFHPDVYVSVLKESLRTASWSETTESFVDPNAETVQWQEITYKDNQVVTDAGFYGVAADEYVVRMEMDDLWDDLEEMDPSDVTLMTRHEPEDGDVWASVNGNTLYVYDMTEKLTMAGVEMKADKVKVYATGDIDPTADASVLDQCVYQGLEQLQTDDPAGESTSTDVAFLDPGCVGDFTHVQEGTEWWYGGVLVKAETHDVNVTVTDYGYEWYEQDEGAGTCTRVTSATRDEPTATLFVEYDVTVSDVVREVTRFTE